MTKLTADPFLFLRKMFNFKTIWRLFLMMLCHYILIWFDLIWHVMKEQKLTRVQGLLGKTPRHWKEFNPWAQQWPTPLFWCHGWDELSWESLDISAKACWWHSWEGWAFAVGLYLSTVLQMFLGPQCLEIAITGLTVVADCRHRLPVVAEECLLPSSA